LNNRAWGERGRKSNRGVDKSKHSTFTADIQLETPFNTDFGIKNERTVK
jgi:hypothetical protein